MVLKDVLQQFLDDEQWQDEIAHDDRDGTDFVSTGFQIDGLRYRLILTTDESPASISVVLISPLKIPKARAREAVIVLNALNVSLVYGSLEIDVEGSVYFRWAFAVEGAKAVPVRFQHLINAATSAFDEFRSAAIGAAAFSKLSAEDIISEYKRSADRPREVMREARIH